MLKTVSSHDDLVFRTGAMLFSHDREGGTLLLDLERALLSTGAASYFSADSRTTCIYFAHEEKINHHDNGKRKFGIQTYCIAQPCSFCCNRSAYGLTIGAAIPETTYWYIHTYKHTHERGEHITYMKTALKHKYMHEHTTRLFWLLGQKKGIMSKFGPHSPRLIKSQGVIHGNEINTNGTLWRKNS